MRTIGVLTSGGDAPGMNACIRAVVRWAIWRKLRVIGIRRGYAGMIAGEMEEMGPGSVSNTIQLGGTILKTARSQEFFEAGWRTRAAEQVRRAGIEGLVLIGGDGTFQGGHKLWLEQQIAVIGVPGTIDNDLYGTDNTVGFDTAVNTALESIDKIRDTAASHDRIFFVEVMGRHAGFIALHVGLAGGAEVIFVPEREQDLHAAWEQLNAGRQRGKTSSIVVVAEGDEAGGAYQVAKAFEQESGLDTRVSILGHIQRGGAPTARDRILASRLGAAAVEALLAGESDKMVGEVNGQIVLTPLEETFTKKKPLNYSLLDLNAVLAK